MRPRPTLIGIPYDAASSFLRGAADAPPHIRRALESPSSNSWSESGINVAEVMADAGDVNCEVKDVRLAVEQGIADVIAGGGIPIALGGDHSISYPILRAIRKAQQKLTILHLDAHSDLYDEFEGDRFSHACPFARIMEERLANRLVQVGVRTQTAHLREQAKRFGVEVFDMRALADGEWPRISGPVYLSLDLDVLDPAYAPGVSHWEPGGLSTREVIDIIGSLAGTLVGADVVEYNPVRDPSGITAMVAAKLVKEIASRMMSS